MAEPHDKTKGGRGARGRHEGRETTKKNHVVAFSRAGSAIFALVDEKCLEEE